MQKKELCKKCPQRDGCEFRKMEGEKELDDWEEVSDVYRFCMHAICDEGQSAIRTVLEGGRHPHHRVQWGGKEYLWFTFYGKASPFVVDPDTGRVSQPDGEMLIPVGVML